jgi:hypothetical protein
MSDEDLNESGEHNTAQQSLQLEGAEPSVETRLAKRRQHDGPISSSDPEAARKLREELAAVEDRQRLMKAVNTAHAQFLKDPASLEKASLPDALKERVRTYTPRYGWEPHPFAPFQLTNNSANARRIKKRIEDLEARAGDKTSERMVGAVRVVENVEANRLQLFFPGKPDEATRQKLKGYGFRFTPTQGCWQAFRSPRATWAANLILGVPAEATPPCEQTEASTAEKDEPGSA